MEKDWTRGRHGGRKNTSSEPRRTLYIKFRATPQEKVEIERLAAAAGFKTSEYIRRSALRQAEYSGKELVEMSRMRSELKKQGTNLNQIAHDLNAALLPGSKEAQFASAARLAMAQIAEIRSRIDAIFDKTERIFRLR